LVLQFQYHVILVLRHKDGGNLTGTVSAEKQVFNLEGRNTNAEALSRSISTLTCGFLIWRSLGNILNLFHAFHLTFQYFGITIKFTGIPDSAG